MARGHDNNCPLSSEDKPSTHAVATLTDQTCVTTAMRSCYSRKLRARGGLNNESNVARCGVRDHFADLHFCRRPEKDSHTEEISAHHYDRRGCNLDPAQDLSRHAAHPCQRRATHALLPEVDPG